MVENHSSSPGEPFFERGWLFDYGLKPQNGKQEQLPSIGQAQHFLAQQHFLGQTPGRSQTPALTATEWVYRYSTIHGQCSMWIFHPSFSFHSHRHRWKPQPLPYTGTAWWKCPTHTFGGGGREAAMDSSPASSFSTFDWRVRMRLHCHQSEPHPIYSRA